MIIEYRRINYLFPLMLSYCKMFKECSIVILILHIKIVVSRLLGETIEESTPVPMSMLTVSSDVWCKFQVNTYDCGEHGMKVYRYYFDTVMRGCKAAAVGDCLYNNNVFWGLAECHEACREPGRRIAETNLTPNVFCRMQPDFGWCTGYQPMWYFDVSTRTCKGFSYSGCGGNQNKFKSTHDCTSTCVPNVEYIPM